MSDVKQLALEVFEERSEAENRISNNSTEVLEDCIESIIEIFKISNKLKKSRILIWQVELYRIYTYQELRIMISFKEDGEEFYNTSIFDNAEHKLGNNRTLKDYIDALKIPEYLYQDIVNYFKENLSKYFETEEFNSDHIIIKLKRKG